MRARYHRLSPLDQMLLSIEDVRTPTHIGALLVLEGPPLLDAAGHLRLEEAGRRGSGGGAVVASAATEPLAAVRGQSSDARWRAGRGPLASSI